MTQSVAGFSLADLNPLDFPQEWDVVYVGGVPSPGLAEVTEPKRANEWDIKKGKGTRGATVTYVGDSPAEFRVTFRLWRPEHFTAWAAFRALLEYDPTKKTIEAIDIMYPSLVDLKIVSVVTRSIGAVTKDATPGLYTVEVEFIEFRKPGNTSAVGTPSTSKAGGGAGASSVTGRQAGEQPDPVADAQLKEIARLQKIAQEP